MLMSLVWDNGVREIHNGQDAIRARLAEVIADPEVVFFAFNAEFEVEITNVVLGLVLGYERVHCTMLHAWTLSFAGRLEDVGEQIGIPEEFAKLKEGKALVTLFSSPAPKNHKAYRYTRETRPEKWAEFERYCVLDSVACQWIQNYIDRWPVRPTFGREWELDRRLNARGLPIDRELVTKAITLNKGLKNALVARMQELTGLANPNSRDQLLAWLGSEPYGYRYYYGDLRKDTVVRCLAVSGPEMHPVVREVLELRLQVSMNSVAKYTAIEKALAEDDHRLRNTIQTIGAQRTQRYAGRIFQPHNLPQPAVDSNAAAEALLSGSPEFVELVFGKGMGIKALSSAIRGCVKSPKGSRLVVRDYGSIESRLLGWVTNCSRINRVFAEDKDTYRDFATVVYHVDYEAVTKEQRKFCKPPVLGCGYMLSGPGLVRYAAKYGVTLTEDVAKELVRLWRDANHEVKTFWWTLWERVLDAVKYGAVFQMPEYKLVVDGRDPAMLRIWLPSGRPIYYYSPRIEINDYGRESLTYMGKNQDTGFWERIFTHPGKLTENIIQAIAADLLKYAIDLIETEWERWPEKMWQLIMHVHDEAVTEARKEVLDFVERLMAWAMSSVPPWAPGLLLASAGYIDNRFKKD
jgi:DNA polymerase